MTVTYNPTSWVDGSTGLSAARLNNIESAIGTMAGSINRSATFTVAASNSSTADKNVADYQCTGTNDDVTINSAITAANGAQGGVVQLCAGTYYTGTTGVQMKSNVWLRGAGNGTLLLISNNVASTAKIIINNTGSAISNIVISDLYFNANKSNNTQTTHGIYLTNTSSSLISNVTGGATKNGIGIWLDSNCTNMIISNSYVLNCDQDNIQINGTRCRVIGCYSSGAGSGYGGINIYGGSYNIVDSCNVTGNDKGIRVQGVGQVISNNVCDSNTSYGISFQGNITTNNTIIKGNVCNGNNYGIYAAGSGSTMTCNVIEGNTCTLNTVAGIYVYNCATMSVNNNAVNNNGQVGLQFYTVTDSTMIGNHAYGNGTAANATYANIGLSNASNYNVVQGNLCRQGTNGNKPSYGIYISTADCSTNQVTNNNTHSGGVSGNFLDSGTGTVTSAGNYNT